MTIIDESFFDKLKKELLPIIENLSEKETLDTTEEEIKKIIGRWNVAIINANSSTYSNGTEFAQDQMVRNLCSVAMSFVLLYRQRFFNELSRNPSNFIMEFFRSIIPESAQGDKDEQRRKLEKNILSILANVTPNKWAKIACPINPQVTILVWDKISNSDKNTMKSLIDDLKEEQKKHLTIVSDMSSGTYEEYKSVIDQKLQSQIKQPDLILMDSILLAEYKSKGALYTAEYYMSEDPNDDMSDLAEIEIAKTVNGNIEAIPITRNFHVAGYGHSFLDENIKTILCKDKIMLSDILKVDEAKGVEEAKRVCQGINPQWESWLNSNGVCPYSQLGGANLNNIDGQFVTSMGELMPFIPMQAARGAHITYTLFAYLSRASQEKNSFISVEKDSSGEKENICLSIYTRDLIKDRIKSLLKLIYLYVPVISLCFDQVRAGVVRANSLGNLWFDPCLPIEAQKFQDEEIFFKKPVQVAINNASLSCLGGYCLALTHSSDSKHHAVTQAKNLAKKYYTSADKQNPSSDSNCRIDYDSTSHNNTQEAHIPTPKKIAKRPNFHGWSMIEEQISNIVRSYMVTVMVIRAIVAECHLGKTRLTPIINSYYNSDIKLSNDPVKNMNIYIEEDIVSEDSINKYLLSSKKMIMKFLSEKCATSEFYNVTDEQETKKWVMSNFDDLIQDRNAILGLLQSAIKGIPSNTKNEIFESIMEYLAVRMSETLVDKLKTLCLSSGWKVSPVDR